MKRKIGTAVLLMVSILIINVRWDLCENFQKPTEKSRHSKVLTFPCGNIKEPEWISWIIIRKILLESGIKKMIVIPETIHFIFGRHINIILNWNRQFQKRNLTKQDI